MCACQTVYVPWGLCGLCGLVPSLNITVPLQSFRDLTTLYSDSGKDEIKRPG